MEFCDFDTQIQIEEMTFSGMSADDRAEYEAWLDEMEAEAIDAMEADEDFTDEDYSSPWYKPFAVFDEENPF